MTFKTGSKMKRFAVSLMIVFSLYCIRFAFSELSQPFSKHVEKAELILIGTLADKQFARNNVTNKYLTDLTFHVEEMIAGTPNIDENTLTFCIPGGKGVDPLTGDKIDHWSSMGQSFSHLNVGDTVFLLLRYNPFIAEWMPRRNGLYPVSNSHGCWFVRSKEVDGETEYRVHIWAGNSERLKDHFLGIKLPVFVEFLEAAKTYPDEINDLADFIDQKIIEGRERRLAPDTRLANAIELTVEERIKTVLNRLKEERE